MKSQKTILVPVFAKPKKSDRVFTLTKNRQKAKVPFSICLAVHCCGDSSHPSSESYTATLLPRDHTQHLSIQPA